MSLRAIRIALIASLIAGCGGSPPRNDEPTTAKEKQRREAAAERDTDSGGKWGGWRYQGDRNECFYVVGRRCFKNENAACQAAHCKSPKKCDIVGGGPATVGCK